MRFVLAFATISVLASCVSAPPPPVRQAPPPVVALPAPAPLASDWRDWPQTPGNWRYATIPGGSTATYGLTGAPAFALRCDLATRRIRLTSLRQPAGAAAMVLRTTSLSRTLAAQPGGAALAAGDPLLDAIGFSRGRFTVEQPGTAPLVLPAWAEVERVVEDCRG